MNRLLALAFLALVAPCLAIDPRNELGKNIYLDGKLLAGRPEGIAFNGRRSEIVIAE